MVNMEVDGHKAYTIAEIINYTTLVIELIFSPGML